MNIQSKLLTMDQVFNLYGIDYKEMEQGEELDVSNFNFKIKSYNHIKNKIEFNNILKVVRKNDCEMYEVSTKLGKFKATGEHKLYTKNGYIKIKNCENKLNLLTSDNTWIDANIKYLNKKFPVLDITVENNENYFSQGILSHNSPETTSGGNALKFFASLRFDVRRSEKDISKDNNEGQLSTIIKIKAVKNKVGTPFRSCEMTLYSGKNNIYGFDLTDDILDLAVSKEIIKKAGTWYSYGEERIGQGKDNAITFLKSSEHIFNEIKNKVLEKINEEIIYSAPIEGSFQDVMNKKQEEIVEEPVRKRGRKKIEEKSEPILEEININEEKVEEEKKEEESTQ